MLELVQLEREHREFADRQTRVVVISLEEREDAEATQRDFPHLVVVSDSDRKLATALGVLHSHSAPDGGDTTAPTTMLVDGRGVVRWIYRADRFVRRLGPKELLATIDEELLAR